MAERVPLSDLRITIVMAVKPVKTGSQRRSGNTAAWLKAEAEAHEIAERLIALFERGGWIVIRPVRTMGGDGVTRGPETPSLGDRDVEDW